MVKFNVHACVQSMQPFLAGRNDTAASRSWSCLGEALAALQALQLPYPFFCAVSRWQWKLFNTCFHPPPCYFPPLGPIDYCFRIVKFSCLLGFLLCTQRLKIVQPIISSLGCFLYVGWVYRHLFSFYSGLLTRFWKCLWVILFSFLVILFLCMKKESRFSVIMHTQSLTQIWCYYMAKM